MTQPRFRVTRLADFILYSYHNKGKAHKASLVRDNLTSNSIRSHEKIIACAF